MRKFRTIVFIVIIPLINLHCAGLKKLGIIPNELEMASGLKAALEQGLFKGFDAFANPGSNSMMLLRLPGEVDKIESILQTLGVTTNLTQITRKLTGAMGAAVLTAKPVFLESLHNMSIKDAAKILITDNPHAATDYFRSTTTENLTKAFIPIVDSTIRLQDAGKEYQQIAAVYNMIPFLNKKMEENLSGFIAGRAIDVMFLIIAKEESDIRSKYQLRKTDLLKKVFNFAEKEITRKYHSNNQ